MHQTPVNLQAWARDSKSEFDHLFRYLLTPRMTAKRTVVCIRKVAKQTPEPPTEATCVLEVPGQITPDWHIFKLFEVLHRGVGLMVCKVDLGPLRCPDRAMDAAVIQTKKAAR